MSFPKNKSKGSPYLSIEKCPQGTPDIDEYSTINKKMLYLSLN